MTGAGAGRESGDDLYNEVTAILAEVSARIHTSVRDARLLRLHSNAIFLLPSAHLVIRIATNPEALHRVAASVAVTRWLAARGFPCVVPADIEGQPLVVRDRAVSVWRYVPTVAEPAATGAELGHLLSVLHAQPPPPRLPGRLDDPFASVTSAITNTPDALSESHRSWLHERIAQLREAWRTMAFPHSAGLVHADAHPNNLMRASSGEVVLGDWDHVATGPREWDLMQIHYTRRRFGRPPDEEVEGFTAAYGWDVRKWAGLDTLIAVREITGLSSYIRTAPTKGSSRRELAYRVDSLRHGDTTVRWEPPRPE